MTRVQYSDAGLLDELIVTVVPVILGSDRPLFEAGLRTVDLDLTGTTSFRSRMVELRYEVRRSSAPPPPARPAGGRRD